ncbi:MAG: UDP-N-acetylmuramoyl-L-alanine--D-glutamate ligase [Rhodospirillales bacterium]
MLDLSQFNDAPVAIFGLGRTGMTTARALLASGVEVWAWDDNPDARARAEAAGLALTDLYGCRWEQVNTLVLSPGIPHTHPTPHPIARLARDSGCAIVCDIELMFRAEKNAAFLGVTGTNGKSTTTALIGHILDGAGIPARIGGNIGAPVLALDPVAQGGCYVLELSSYQLELTPSAAFKIAVLLNISADHLDRHGGMDGYVEAKKRIFANQGDSDVAVIGVDDPYCKAIFESLAHAGSKRVVPISSISRVEGGVYARDGVLHDDLEGENRAVLDMRGIATLPGVHNWQNAAAAYAAAKTIGIESGRIVAGLQTYPGMPRRQELIAVIDGVSYINDSKATNVESAVRALACYDMICWIAGGRSKDTALDAIAPFAPRIVTAFLIGEAAAPFERDLSGTMKVERCGTLDVAVERARACALEAKKSGAAVVLLSPACASFDQFRDFEDRGEAFRALVGALPGHRAELPHLKAGAI